MGPIARLVPGTTLGLADREFVLAARSMGVSRRRILLVEILPSIIPVLAATAFIFMAAIVIAEGSISFLGYGIPPPTPTWGGMIAEGRMWLELSRQLVFVPSVVLLQLKIGAKSENPPYARSSPATSPPAISPAR